MSFRLRVLALVVLVGVTATATTAWLTLRQASQQITESQVADRATIAHITAELTRYGRAHGTWEGVAGLVGGLGRATGQRIRLVTEYGEVLVDTDHLQGRAARPPASPPISVNPRPTLEIPEGVDPEAATRDAVRLYRRTVMFTACLTRHQLAVHPTGDEPYGVPLYEADPVAGAGELATLRECRAGMARYGREPTAVAGLLGGCRARDEASATGNQASTPDHAACLQSVFTQAAGAFAPVPLEVYLGAVEEDPPSPLTPGPVLAAAGLVALFAIAGTVLISRRVLRPIGALTSASRRLGAGDLAERVPVVGNDELAELARSFNRMADSLQRGEERQRRLVADVAHELRTPLANLRGYLEALKDGVVTPDPELFVSLHEEAVLQQRIVDDLQDLALAEAGSLVYHPEPVELGELLETCRAAHQAVADPAGVRLVVSAPEPVTVHVDPDRFRQVLGNLVTNALRVTGAGGSVTLSARREDGRAVTTVADTGAGIAAADLPYLFDRFWRADAARGRGTGGSGLGLAITRQIVTDHGGTVSVASELGVGTTFTITLPASAPDPLPGGGGA